MAEFLDPDSAGCATPKSSGGKGACISHDDEIK